MKNRSILGRAGSPSRPSLNIRDDIGRAGSPSRPLPNPSHKNGALGESALPNPLPQRKRLIHTPPPWAQEGSTFFITINCIPRGQNQLAIPEIAMLIEESLRVRIEKGYWWPHLTLLMPDHIHTLMILSPDQEIAKVIKDWKRYLARHAGIHWQRDFFDHRIRNEASLQEKWSYILQNPVRAGLVTTAEHWPYVWLNGIDKNGRDDPGRDGSPSRPSPNIKDDLGRAGSPSQPPLNIKDDIGRAGSPNRPQSNQPSLNIKDDLGRAGSPSRPQPNRPHEDGALGESALPNSLPKSIPPTTSKKP
jgi:putative transposase